MLSVYEHLECISKVNQTFIALIPKIDYLEEIKHFRPISLCNVIYKLVTKLLASRLKHLMPKLIAPTQCAFVRGRNLSNNIIIA